MPRGGNRSALHTATCHAIEKYLASRGAWHFRVRGGLGQRRGVPDILAVLGGWAVAVEVKTGVAPRLTAQQEEQRRGLEHAGAVYILARSVDDVEAALLSAGLVEAPSLVRRD
jgi:Holliday junction resolvase